jgi:hypothetical protein
VAVVPSSRAAEPQGGIVERLSIGVWRGYGSAAFYARLVGADDAVRLSPAFRAGWLPWKPRLPLEQTASALRALQALEASLLAEGWERCAPEPDAKWHELEFRRTVQMPRETA